jgi:hypothetical protein
MLWMWLALRSPSRTSWLLVMLSVAVLSSSGWVACGAGELGARRVPTPAGIWLRPAKRLPARLRLMLQRHQQQQITSTSWVCIGKPSSRPGVPVCVPTAIKARGSDLCVRVDLRLG